MPRRLCTGLCMNMWKARVWQRAAGWQKPEGYSVGTASVLAIRLPPCPLLTLARWADRDELREAHHPTADDSNAVAQAAVKRASPKFQHHEEMEREVGAEQGVELAELLVAGSSS